MTNKQQQYEIQKKNEKPFKSSVDLHSCIESDMVCALTIYSSFVDGVSSNETEYLSIRTKNTHTYMYVSLRIRSDRNYWLIETQMLLFF